MYIYIYICIYICIYIYIYIYIYILYIFTLTGLWINSSLRQNVTKYWACLIGGVYSQVVWMQIHFPQFLHPKTISIILLLQNNYNKTCGQILCGPTLRLSQNFLTDQERGMQKQKNTPVLHITFKSRHAHSHTHARMHAHTHTDTHTTSLSFKLKLLFSLLLISLECVCVCVCVCVWLWCVFWFNVHESCCYEYKWKATVNRRTPRTSSIWLHQLTQSWLLTKKLKAPWENFQSLD